MKLIVGLGNPGKEYDGTRHNTGFMVIDAILNSMGNPKTKEKFGGLYYEYQKDNEKIILLKPQEYINLSGEVIKRYVDYFNIDIKDILIINDDLDLQVGNYRLRESGSSAGHNGLKNIESNLKTENYKRIKIGISNDKEINTKDYVLGKYNKDDLDIINKEIEEIVMILNEYSTTPFDKLMSKYNKKQ